MSNYERIIKIYKKYCIDPMLDAILDYGVSSTSELEERLNAFSKKQIETLEGLVENHYGKKLLKSK